MDASKSLRTLVSRVAGGTLLTMFGFGILVPPWDRIAASGHLHWLEAHRKPVVVSAMLFCIVAGFAISMPAESALIQGRENGLWPEGQLEKLRLRITSLFYVNLAVGLSVIILSAFDFLGHTNALVWAFMVSTQAISRLISTLKGAKPSQHETQLSLSNAQPIHSQEWGRSAR